MGPLGGGASVADASAAAEDAGAGEDVEDVSDEGGGQSGRPVEVDQVVKRVPAGKVSRWKTAGPVAADSAARAS